jgi:glycosyltransferase involved in cell wall biosynthesis
VDDEPPGRRVTVEMRTMAMVNRTVSVVLPTHNRAALLPRAIDSVLAQTWPNWELIVVDDGSTDDTVSIVQRYQSAHPQRVVFVHQEHGGASTARNTGLARASGQWIAFLDSDDVFAPDKLARQVALFEARADLGLVFSDMSVHTVDGVYHASAFDTYTPRLRSLPVEPLDGDCRLCPLNFVDYLVRDYLIPTITGMIHRNVVQAGVRFSPQQSYSEEWLFFLEIATGWRCGFIDAPLSVQHCQPGSVSQRSVVHNLAQQRQVLRCIRSDFPYVSREARRAVRRHLSTCCRQLGFDAFKAGRFDEAGQHFLEAWRAWPSIRPFAYFAQASWRRWTRGDRVAS